MRDERKCYGFGERARECRKRKGLKQKDVCEVMNISTAVYSNWEADKNEPCLLDALLLSEILCTTLEYLIAGDPN